MTFLLPPLRRAAVTLLVGLAPVAATAQPAALGADELAALYQAAGLRAQGTAFLRSGCATPLHPSFELRDLDRDGRTDVLLYVGPSDCFPESLGGNVALFMRDPAGRWIDRFGFVPGVEVIDQGAGPTGLPDLGVANPGGCMPVYRWNGERYLASSQKAIQPGGCQFRQ
jgi:hypothetical protein